MTKYKCFFMRNEFIRNSVLGDILGDMKNMKLSWLQKELFPLPFLEFRYIFSFFCSFRNITIKFYIKIFLGIIIILICRTLRLSKCMKNYLKQKRQLDLMADVINDQVFAWNKYVKLFLLVVSALVNVTNWCALSLLVALLVARNAHDK